METSFRGFNQPFLLKPELWYSLIPRISHRDLVNLFLTAKFVDFSQAQDNFNITREIWCKHVSLVTLVDTLYHVYVKKIDTVFFTIISIRNEINIEVSQAEFQKLIDSDKPDYIEKIIRIALKAGSLDMFRSWIARLIIANADCLPDLLSYATTCEIGSKAIPLLICKMNELLLPDQFELVVYNWISLPMKNEEFYLEDDDGIQFFRKTILKILLDASWYLFNLVADNNLNISEEGNFSRDEIDLNLRLIINGLNIIRSLLNYKLVWWNVIIVQLKSKQSDFALQILRKTPCPLLLLQSSRNEILCVATENNHIEFIVEFLDKFNISHALSIDK